MTLLATRFAPSDVEMLLLALTHAGFTLRSDDPAALRDVLKLVHSHVKGGAPSAAVSVDSAAGSGVAAPGSIAALVSKLVPRAAPTASTTAPSRTSSSAAVGGGVTRNSVMLDLLLDLKNNRRRPEHEAILERGVQLRRWLGRLAGKAAGVGGGASAASSDRALRISWEDLMSIPTNGRWWLVGSSWAGRLAGPSSSSSSSADAGGKRGGGAGTDTPAAGYTAAETSLLEVARAMRMNTPARRSVFVALMGAEDADSALERLLKLGLKGANEREIVRVVLDCAAQEGAVNPFYGDVAGRLCGYNPRFKFTFQLCFWDAFKTLDDVGTGSPRRTFNLARLLATLVTRFTLSLAVLKVVDLTPGSTPASTTLFVKALLTAVLIDAKGQNDVAAIFSRLGGGGGTGKDRKAAAADGGAASRDKLLLRDGLLVFLRQHVSAGGLAAGVAARGEGVAAGLDGNDLKERLRTARKALESVTGTAQEEVMGYGED